ncbi:uncharacterized protein [Notothenia coriiceps]|uniref:Beta-adaptin appendage C-terminal subdomain domain-containing protein n=1 Tax=Notothenia coriiceps TaxID=8208 RepID=A0A6I9N4C8_9TELE|nr:PREDICTED: uncharacterized protein LOC104946237 [Notothenia coriiceps]
MTIKANLFFRKKQTLRLSTCSCILILSSLTFFPSFPVTSHLSRSASDRARGCSDSSAEGLASSVAPPLSLSLTPVLSPEEFERLWLQRQDLHTEQDAEKREEEQDCACLVEHIRGPAIAHCSPQSLQAAMQLVNIQTLAFTPPHTLPWRVYLFTHTQHTHSGYAPHSTLIVGELLYTGEANQRVRLVKTGSDDGDLVEGSNEEHVREGGDPTSAGLRESARENGEEEEVKVTLKQQPRDDSALKGFLSILTTVLHTLSSERA